MEEFKLKDLNKNYYLVQFTRRTGKIIVSLGGKGFAILRLWALQNTRLKSRDTIIFDEDGRVCWYYEGTGDFPNIKVINGEQHIDEYCEGLLESCREGLTIKEKEYEDGLEKKDS